MCPSGAHSCVGMYAWGQGRRRALILSVTLHRSSWVLSVHGGASGGGLGGGDGGGEGGEGGEWEASSKSTLSAGVLEASSTGSHCSGQATPNFLTRLQCVAGTSQNV